MRSVLLLVGVYAMVPGLVTLICHVVDVRRLLCPRCPGCGERMRTVRRGGRTRFWCGNDKCPEYEFRQKTSAFFSGPRGKPPVFGNMEVSKGDHDEDQETESGD